MYLHMYNLSVVNNEQSQFKPSQDRPPRLKLDLSAAHQRMRQGCSQTLTKLHHGEHYLLIRLVISKGHHRMPNKSSPRLNQSLPLTLSMDTFLAIGALLIIMNSPWESL